MVDSYPWDAATLTHLYKALIVANVSKDEGRGKLFDIIAGA
jgi:hypothetical protein